ncbi:MAG: MFS transporter [Rhodospirillales bacterium]|nr:MAG: MFS transporter [Rhodospirillales bacterium]
MAALDRRLLFLYALPAFALAMPTIPVYVFLPTFYADTLGLGLTATGAALLLARLFDVITDPTVGYLSDRWRTPLGRRKPWIAVGSVIAAIALVRLFQPPEAVDAGYLVLWAILLYVGWTLVAVPYTAWGAEISGDYHERSRITGSREAAMILGILAAGSVPALVAGLGGDEAMGLAGVAWLAVAVGAPAMVMMLWRVPEAPAAATPVSRPHRDGWRAAVENRPFVRLLTAWFVNGLANGLPAVLFPLYLQHALGAGTVASGVLIFVYFVSGVLAIPLWLRLSRKVGKHRAWCAAMAMACCAFVWVPFLEHGQIGLFFIICVFTGMALGADLALPPAMQADVIDLDRLRTGRQRAGLFFALWSMGYKLALAAAVGLAFPALDLVGFDAGGANTAGAILALTLFYAAVPTGLKVVAIALVWHHPITARRQAIIQRRLATRIPV